MRGCRGEGKGKVSSERGILGTWHKISAKHLTAYLDEMTFRFNNRDNPYLFRDTMMKLIEAPGWSIRNSQRPNRNVLLTIFPHP
jgi:hypothetical protein